MDVQEELEVEGDANGVGIDVRGNKHMTTQIRIVLEDTNSQNLAGLTEP